MTSSTSLFATFYRQTTPETHTTADIFIIFTKVDIGIIADTQLLFNFLLKLYPTNLSEPNLT